MIELIPAIDIIDGKCVRLSQGDYDSKKVYNENPVEVALELEAHGIRRLHVVDLDGAASHHVVNYRTLEQIAVRTSLIIDFGGGVKSDEDLEEKDILSRNDVKQWYTETGIALLSVLIDELNVQGHKRLVIHENGDVLVTVEGKEQTVDTIPDFPPRPAWDDLCVLAREDDISAEVRGQELAVSWP